MARDIAGATLSSNRIGFAGMSDLTGDWSVAQWVYVRSAANTGRFFGGGTGLDTLTYQGVRCASATDTSPLCSQGFATTQADCTSGTALTTNIWSLVVGMCDSSGAMGTANQTHIFQGDVATAMFQPSETLVTGAGARRTGTTLYRVGNVPSSGTLNKGFDGIIGLTLVYNRLLTLAEAEGIRNGLIPPDAIFWAPLNDSTLAQNVDLVSGVNGTVTGAAVAVAEDPPVAYYQPHVSVVQPSATTTQTISPSGIASGEAWGTAVITTGPVTVSPAGIASAETWGSATVTPGAVTISPAGIASAEAWGTATITIAAPATISPAGIPSEETWGSATVTPGDVTISPAGIPSEEAWGTALISRPTIFQPPADAVVPPVYMWPDSYAPVPSISQRLFRHYKPRYAGRNIFKLANGTYTETAPYPNIDASTQPGQMGDTTVLKTYLGGHLYEVDAEEAAELIAAGYGPWVS